jgi:hypothetical protein
MRLDRRRALVDVVTALVPLVVTSGKILPAPLYLG